MLLHVFQPLTFTHFTLITHKIFAKSIHTCCESPKKQQFGSRVFRQLLMQSHKFDYSDSLALCYAISCVLVLLFSIYRYVGMHVCMWTRVLWAPWPSVV